jgi:SAM-dependent methyltransferase
VTRALSSCNPPSEWLLNAGAGIYQIGIKRWKEVAVDLFSKPIQAQERAICASIERLPFMSESFGAVVCVGEVLAYCDPAKALKEFARVLVPQGILICDFASSRSFRYLFMPSSGRAADLVTDDYNGSPEKTWIYDPHYIKSLLSSFSLVVKAESGTHTWSSLARLLGISSSTASIFQRKMDWVNLPNRWAEVMTILAVRGANGS